MQTLPCLLIILIVEASRHLKIKDLLSTGFVWSRIMPVWAPNISKAGIFCLLRDLWSSCCLQHVNDVTDTSVLTETFQDSVPSSCEMRALRPEGIFVTQVKDGSWHVTHDIPVQSQCQAHSGKFEQGVNSTVTPQCSRRARRPFKTKAGAGTHHGVGAF